MATDKKTATQAELMENVKHNGIELRFNAEPSSFLQSKLRSKGFRPSKIPFMWYTERTDDTLDFAKSVSEVISHSPDGPEVHLAPSFEVSKANIEKKEFSFINISIKSGENKSYIVFEPSKPKAEVIATSFAKKTFPKEIATIVVKPRSNIREARLLFDEKRIISGELVALPNDTSSQLKPILHKESEKYGAGKKNKKPSQHQINQEIESLIDRIDTEKRIFTEEEKNFIRRYTGSGGLIEQGATGRGILYEYYTGDVVVRKMWDLAHHYAYDGGPVLEPSVGTGNFLKYVPKGTEAVGYETNHYAARIAQTLYPSVAIYERSFETIFFTGNIHLKDDFSNKRYSLVIGNPPYGEFSGKYAGLGEKKWTRCKQYEHYFTSRGLDLLKPGGLLIYILPSDFLKNESDHLTAERIADKCVGLDRFRLGDGAFKTTDINTDIVVLKRT